VRPREDGEDVPAVQALPVRVRPGHVADQAAVRTGVPLQQERQMGGERLAAVCGDEQAEAVGLDEGVQFGRVGLRVSGRDIHGRSPRSGRGGGFGTVREAERQSRKAVFRKCLIQSREVELPGQDPNLDKRLAEQGPWQSDQAAADGPAPPPQRRFTFAAASGSIFSRASTTLARTPSSREPCQTSSRAGTAALASGP
jgi:hypothetical protein